METVWLIGRLAGEAQTLAASIASVLPGADVVRFDSLMQALVCPVAVPDLVVVVQHRPHEHSQRDVDALIAGAPLASLVLAAGPWCASLMRSDRIWPESVFVPFDDVPHRIHRLKLAGDGSTNRLPLTAGRDEAVMFDLPQTTVLKKFRAAPIAIVAADVAFRAMLIDAAGEFNAVIVDEQSMPAGTTVFWDVTCDIDAPQAVAHIERWRKAGVRVVAFIALPTSSLRAQLQQCGVNSVISKPFSQDALERAIADVAE